MHSSCNGNAVNISLPKSSREYIKRVLCQDSSKIDVYLVPEKTTMFHVGKPMINKSHNTCIVHSTQLVKNPRNWVKKDISLIEPRKKER